MGAARCSEEEFIALFQAHGAKETARILDIDERRVYARRASIEKREGQRIFAPSSRESQHSPRIELDIENGLILVGSDAHYWPDRISTAHRAFVRFIGEMKPRAVIMNGDVFDGASISRHPPIGWESRPSVIREIEACQERLGEIEKAAGKARKIWTLGNHDMRFESRLAMAAPEYARVHGIHLRDHFPFWEPAWSCWINDSVVIKHRFKNGVHATHNATLWSGKTMVTGHLHSLKVTPLTDYDGTRWGIDCGTLAEPGGPQFIDYLEDNPTNWRSGFVVLTFYKGRLLWPETVSVFDQEHVEFRGKVYKV